MTPSFSCPYCGITKDKRELINYHIRRYHTHPHDNKQCPICDKLIHSSVFAVCHFFNYRNTPEFRKKWGVASIRPWLLHLSVRLFSADRRKMDSTKMKNTNFILFSRLCNISGPIGPTGMVNLSKFAVFYKENCQKTFRTPDSKNKRPI